MNAPFDLIEQNMKLRFVDFPTSLNDVVFMNDRESAIFYNQLFQNNGPFHYWWLKNNFSKLTKYSTYFIGIGLFSILLYFLFSKFVFSGNGEITLGMGFSIPLMSLLLGTLLFAVKVKSNKDDSNDLYNVSFDASEKHSEEIKKLNLLFKNLVYASKYDQALKLIDTLLDFNPNEPDLLNNKAALLFISGKEFIAYGIIDEVLKKDKKNRIALENKAMMQYLDQKYKKAINTINKVNDQNNTKILLKKAICEYRDLNFKESFSLSNKILETNHKNIYAILLNGMSLANQGRFNSAKKAFEWALRLDPGNKLAKEWIKIVELG